MVIVVLPENSREHIYQQWEYVLCNFKPDLACTVGEDKNWVKSVDVQTIESIDDLPEDHSLVLLSPRNSLYMPGDVSLENFRHPDDAIYAFGSDHRHLQESYFGERKPDHSVFVPTDTKDDMYSWVAYATAMWDRRMKAVR